MSVKYRFCSWVPLNKINYPILLFNASPGALSLLSGDIDEDAIPWESVLEKGSSDVIAWVASKYPERIYWDALSSNSCDEAVSMLTANPDKVFWKNLSPSGSSASIALLRSAPIEKLDFNKLSGNPDPEVVKFLMENESHIDWRALSANTNPVAIALLATEPGCVRWSILSEYQSNEGLELASGELEDCIDMCALSANSCNRAIEILSNNLDEIEWHSLSGNPNPGATALLRGAIDEIDWSELCSVATPEAIALLAEHRDEIDWGRLAKNPAAGALLAEKTAELACSDFSWGDMVENIYPDSEVRFDTPVISKRCIDIIENLSNPTRYADAVAFNDVWMKDVKFWYNLTENPCIIEQYYD